MCARINLKTITQEIVSNNNDEQLKSLNIKLCTEQESFMHFLNQQFLLSLFLLVRLQSIIEYLIFYSTKLKWSILDNQMNKYFGIFLRTKLLFDSLKAKFWTWASDRKPPYSHFQESRLLLNEFLIGTYGLMEGDLGTTLSVCTEQKMKLDLLELIFLKKNFLYKSWNFLSLGGRGVVWKYSFNELTRIKLAVFM